MSIRIRILSGYLAGLLLTISLLTGCSAIKPYPNALVKNMRILTETDSNSLFSKVHAALDIYSVDGQCRAEYQGTVNLDKPSVSVGTPSDRLSYLVFSFASSSFLANSSSTISYDTLLKPRVGYHYDVKVSYIDDIYNVVIQETHPRESANSEIERKYLSACNTRTKSEPKGSDSIGY